MALFSCLIFYFLAIQGSVVLGFMRNCDTSRCHDVGLRRDMERIGYVPTTEEQLQRLCPPTLTGVRCAVETIQGCVGRNLVELSRSDNKSAAAFAHGVVSISNLINDICTPGSEMRQSSMVLGFIENCDIEKCKDLELKRELERIDWMPTTEEQLNTLCPPMLRVLRCGVESIQECTGQDVVELATSDNKTVAAIGHVIVSIGNLVIDICTPGTEMRENYLYSISCFKDLVMDPAPTMKCYQQGYAVYSTYEQSKALLGNAVEDKESESWCMVTAYTLACFASELHDTCGEVARKTFVDTLRRFQSLKWNECTEANIRNLKTEFLDFLELEEQRKSIFHSVFESKKRRK